MGKLLAKLLLLLGVVLGLKAALWYGLHTYRPKRTMRYEAAYKRDSLLWPIRRQVNTVFIGSSRTAFSLIPAQFDSLTHQQTHSFNHGLSGTFVPATFDEAERIIDMDGLALKTLFFELSFPLTTAGTDPFDQESPTDELLFMADYARQQATGLDVVGELTRTTNDVLVKALMLKNTVTFAVNSLNKPVDDNFVMTPGGYRYYRSVNWIDPLEVAKSASERSRERLPTAKADTVPTRYRQRIQRLIERCNQRKVALYFVRPNHLTTTEKRLLPGIEAAIPARYRFGMPARYNSLYQMGVYCSDDGMHLNRRGARLFTARFAEHYHQRTRSGKSRTP
jgi:hypothetical protein